ncbi:MAG: hypothetical protein H6741_07500 [Alphaproteobacteria bacterium]|nr:hypothetical protein [Alphaproteobacteria bacterium]MCB9792560.1 hypothetical protein [Alphaproteobacteria bacterium]
MILLLTLACAPAEDGQDYRVPPSYDRPARFFEPYAAFVLLDGAWDGETLSAFGGAGEDMRGTQAPEFRVRFASEEYFSHFDRRDTCEWIGRPHPERILEGDPRYPTEEVEFFEVWALHLEEADNLCRSFDPEVWGATTPGSAILATQPLVAFAPMSDSLGDSLESWVTFRRQDWDDYAPWVYGAWVFLPTGEDGAYEGNELNYTFTYALNPDGDRALARDGGPSPVTPEALREGFIGAIESHDWMGLYAWVFEP